MSQEAAIATVIAKIGQGFSRQYRLTKTDEYSSVFDFRRAIRGKLFMLHYLPRNSPDAEARLGLVIGKKQLKRAVHRNLVKRLARENFRVRRAGLAGYDLVLRLMVRPERLDRHLIAEDIVSVLQKLRPRQTSAGGKAD